MDQQEHKEDLKQESTLDTETTPVYTNGSDGPIDEGDGLPLPDYGDGEIPEMLVLGDDNLFLDITIYAYSDKETRRLKSIVTEPSFILRGMGWVEFPIETRWTLPTKKQMDDYRERATRYSAAARGSIVNRSILQELLIRNHLKELCFLNPDGSKKPMELRMSKNSSSLSNQAMTLLNKFHPSVLDLLFVKFVDEAALLI